MEDTYRHQALRRQLVEGLRRQSIADERVLTAMEKLPRHFFIEKAFEEWAYQDKPFPIGCEQTISQPWTVAFQTALLQVEKRQKILEIGTGSGYQAAVLALMGARVFTIERHQPLYEKARSMMKALGLGGVRCYYKDGYLGLPEMAPFDRILVTCGAPEIPAQLITQLSVGGIMVIPVGIKQQRMIRLIKRSETEWETQDHGDFRFVPFLSGTA
ncbi:MAG: protein-L-isoaspartate(D-aspartate) O-methyltransferase [Saprospiraceae bacterium]